MDVDWQPDLDRWLAPFVDALWHKTRARMCPACITRLVKETAKVFSRWQCARAGAAMISFIISWLPEFGTVVHSKLPY